MPPENQTQSEEQRTLGGAEDRDTTDGEQATVGESTEGTSTGRQHGLDAVRVGETNEPTEENAAEINTSQDRRTDEEMNGISELASMQVGTFAEAAATTAAVLEPLDQQEEEEDQELLAMKRAAYMGLDSGCDYHREQTEDQYNGLTAVPVTNSSIGTVQAQAQLVSPDSHVPGNMTQQPLVSQQAEIIEIQQHGHDTQAEVVEQTHHIRQPVAQSPASSVTSTSVPESQRAEATVIDSEPLSQFSETFEETPDWKLSGEAEVLSADGVSADDWGDRKVPATETIPFDDQLTEITGDEAAYECQSSDVTIVSQNFVHHEPAEVVSIQQEIHPAEFLDQGSAHAELMGQEAEPVYGSLPENHSHTRVAAASSVEVSIQDHAIPVPNDNATVATATTDQTGLYNEECPMASAVASQGDLDRIVTSTSVPIDHQEFQVAARVESPTHDELERHNSGNPEPTVLADLDSDALIGSCSVDLPYTVADSESTRSGLALDQSAQVVAIQEEVHPSELTDDAEAVLIGDDYGAPTTTQPAPYHPVENSEAGVVIAQDHAPFDQHALVVDIEEDVHPSLLVDGNGARADYIGTDHTYPVEEGRTETSLNSSNLVAEATVMAMGPDGSHSASAEGAVSAASLPSAEKGVLNSPQAAVLPEVSAPVEDAWPQKPQPESQTPFPLPGDDDDRPDWLHETPPREVFGSTGQEVSNLSTSSLSDRSPGVSSQRLSQISTNIARGTNHLMEFLVGDGKPPFANRRGRSNDRDIASLVVPRSLLPWSVIFSPPTRMWVATLQTNQRALDRNNIADASKSLRAFSLPTEKAAVALAKAWTPPRMLPRSNTCHICKSKFALLRRPCHCRNCGVVVCKDCSVTWPTKMIPATYNFKKENSITACLSCDWLNNNFRLALLEGNQDKAVAIHATGNINLHAPFGNVKGELFYPVHCAVLGGSLPLLKWLVDENCCPIKSLRVSGGSGGTYTPIVTSKGRSLLGIAMENKDIQIIRYLVVRKGISLAGEQDITFEMLLRNLDKLLRLIPEDIVLEGYGGTNEESQRTPMSDFSPSAPVDGETLSPIRDHADLFDEMQQETNDEEDCKSCLLYCCFGIGSFYFQLLTLSNVDVL